MNRRDFLRRSGFTLAGAALGMTPWGRASANPAVGGAGPYGALLAADGNGIRLPAGFSSRVIARTGQLVSNTSYTWHDRPDGAAIFRQPGGYVYACNSEVSSGGGVGAIAFDHDGSIVDAYSILSGTRRNCAGGRTEWDTWLSCEEVEDGLVYECDPFGVNAGVARPSMGTFNHEAACSHLEERRLYLTEDKGDSGFYRFTPTVWGDLSAGLLEVAVVSGVNVTWATIPNPNPNGGQQATRYQVASATEFDGGEGIVCFRDHIYFTTKGDNKVWVYHPATQTIGVEYDASLDPSSQLTGVDNIDASRTGDLLVAEDGGNMELVLLGPDCVASPLLRVTGQNSSEITGPAFDPTGRRLYFNSQTGTDGDGITYEITGPFRRI